MTNKKRSMLYRLSLIIVFFFISLLSADEICKMRLIECPENFNNRTIIVPKKVTSVSSNFFVCMPQHLIEDVVVKVDHHQ